MGLSRLFGKSRNNFRDGNSLDALDPNERAELIARAEAEVEISRVEYELAKVELREAEAERRRSQEAMAAARSEWLESSRVEITSPDETALVLLPESVEDLYGIVTAGSSRASEILDDLGDVNEPHVLDRHSRLVQAQIELMDIRNEIIRKVNEVGYHKHHAAVDIGFEWLAIAMDAVDALDMSIEELCDWQSHR